jgi:hypothetical protein
MIVFHLIMIFGALGGLSVVNLVVLCKAFDGSNDSDTD